MFTLTKRDGRWVVLDTEGNILAIRDEQQEAIAELSKLAAERMSLAVDADGDGQPDGLLPERWRGPIARSKLTGDGRDFSTTKWSWRDPSESRLPIMWQTNTQIGHFDAVLAGVITRLWMDGTTVMAEGAFFDTDTGREFRDVLRASGRWGVSVDPGQVEWEDTCTKWSEDGEWCEEGLTTFLAYEIIGVTGTPFPAFDDAWIELASGDENDESGVPEGEASRVLAFENMPEHEFADDDEDGLCDYESDGEVCGGTEDQHTGAAPAEDEEAAARKPAVAASARGPVPREWFDMPPMEQLSGAPHINIDEPDENGWRRTWGWVATFDQCHIGFRNVCHTAPDKIDMARFRAGSVMTTDGLYPTGPLVFGTDHLQDLYATPEQAIDYLAHTGTAWADVTVGVNELGIWYSGVVRPHINDDQVHVLRASANSGEWREVDGELKLVAVLAVNSPGFTVPRALVASGKAVPVEARGLRVRVVNGRAVAALGLGSRAGCPECRKREHEASRSHEQNDQRIERVLALMEVIERRTRALQPSRRDQLAARIAASRR